MAHLWSWEASGQLIETPLAGGRSPVALVPTAEPPRAAASDPPAAQVTRAAAAGGMWVLLVARGAHVTVNGEPLVTGIRVLANRDEIRTPDGTWWFSTEEVARIEECPPCDRGLRCPRCTRPIDAGSPAVRCPNAECGRWHHETADFPCWSSVPFCAACSGPTECGTDRRWMPQER